MRRPVRGINDDDDCRCWRRFWDRLCIRRESFGGVERPAAGSGLGAGALGCLRRAASGAGIFRRSWVEDHGSGRSGAVDDLHGQHGPRPVPGQGPRHPDSRPRRMQATRNPQGRPPPERRLPMRRHGVPNHRCRNPRNTNQLKTKGLRGMASRSRKARGAFSIPASIQRPNTLFLMESALDAVAAIALQQTPKDTTVFASTAGATPNLPKWIEAWKPARILCAFDADPVGDQNAEALAKHDPRVQRCRSEGARDWNEIIRKEPSTTERPEKPSDYPSNTPSLIVSVRTRFSISGSFFQVGQSPHRLSVHAFGTQSGATVQSSGHRNTRRKRVATAFATRTDVSRGGICRSVWLSRM